MEMERFKFRETVWNWSKNTVFSFLQLIFETRGVYEWKERCGWEFRNDSGTDGKITFFKLGKQGTFLVLTLLSYLSLPAIWHSHPFEKLIFQIAKE